MSDSTNSNLFLLRLFGPKVDQISYGVFRVAIIAIAVLLPLDRIGFLSWLHVTILTLLLILQRWLYVTLRGWFSKQQNLSNKQSYLFLLPFLGVMLVQFTSSLVHPLNHAAFTLLVLALKAFMLAQLTKEADLNLFERTTIIVSAIIVAFGFYQYITGALGAPLWLSGLSPQYAAGWTFFFPRPQSTALEPLFLGFYLFIPLSLLTLRVLSGQALQRWQRWTLLGSLTLLILTISRGAILGYLVALTISIIAMRPEPKKLIQMGVVLLQAIAIAALLTLIAGLTTKVNALPSFDRHLVDLHDKSAQNRYKGVNPAIRAILQRPLTGHGIVNADDNAGAKLKVNNSYLTILVEQGLVGFLLYLPIVAVFAYCLICSFRNRFSGRYAPYVMALIAMGIQANTFEAFQLLRLWVVMAMLVAALAIERQNQSKLKTVKA